MARIHELKILPSYFTAIADGQKTFEVRKNDRGFQVGDFLALNGYDGEEYLGYSMLVEIMYILPLDELVGCEGYVVMSIVPRLCRSFSEGVCDIIL